MAGQSMKTVALYARIVKMNNTIEVRDEIIAWIDDAINELLGERDGY